MTHARPDATCEPTGEHARSERYRLFADERRRVTMDRLTEREGSIDLERLAMEVATRETDGRRPSTAERDEVAVDLHHVHLPKLADAGVVTYDRETKRVEPGYVA